MELSGYRLAGEVLRADSYRFFRAVRELDQQPVLLKTAPPSPPDGPDAAAFEREFALLREMRITGLPRALDLVHEGSATVLVLEDPGLLPLRSRLTSTGLEPGLFFGVALQLCQVFEALHQRNVRHGGLSSATTWVNDDFDELQLLDLSLASRGAQDSRVSPAPIRADLAPYLSPEQTGRTSRRVDYRSDFYSLGALLYELLTGQPPFIAGDLLELVHAHIARTPVPPSTRNPRVPEQVSRLVLRLLAKSTEDRYQTARGITLDLERCAREWHESGGVAPFDLARFDVSERFLIPQRLYGRDREIAELLRAFDDTCRGQTALVLVSGYSGVGKTSFISELYGPIVRQRGSFTTGKVDPVGRNTPYGALIQAFGALLRQLLAESEELLAGWRTGIAQALGPNGSVLIEVIPELEFIIGRQSPPPPLDPTEALNRFRFAFQSFVGVLAGPEHPLVVFLDDLQWVDPATLDLLQGLLTGPDIRHLLVIGAYRDNEVNDGHPLSEAAARLGASGCDVRKVSLGPLTAADLDLFLSDTLRTDPSEVESLRDVVLQKTGGNPFFVIQFLRALYEERLITFDRGRSGWVFHTAAIASARMTDNVVDLMTAKIRRLSGRASRVVTLAACVGSTFSWGRLLTVSRLLPDEAGAGLAEALEAGLIRLAGTPFDFRGTRQASDVTYQFLHDRVQQAAYELIPEDKRAPIHLDAGRLLLDETGQDVADDRLFEIVNHFRVGGSLMTDRDERLRVARLHLAAGRKARTSGAFEAAFDYFVGGLAIVDDAWWHDEYDLMFALGLEAAECEYLVGRFERAERRFDDLLGLADGRLDRARVYGHRIVLYENQSRYGAAVDSAREGLALLGLSLPAEPEAAQTALDFEIETIDRLLGDRPISSLIELPVMSDPDMRQILRLLTAMWAPAYLSGNQILTRLISATMVRLSLAHGHTEESAYGYVTHAITVGPVRREYQQAYEWGRLALAVNARFDHAKQRAKIYQQFHAHVKLWCESFESCIPHARDARTSGLEAGDFTYAGYGAVTETWHAMLVTRNLDEFVREYASLQGLLEKIRMLDFLAVLKVILGWARALQGRTSGPLSLSSAEFDEAAFAATYEQAAPFFLTFLYTVRVQLCVIHGEFEAALEAARLARNVTLTGTIWPVLLDFWGGLALAGSCAVATEPERSARLTELASARQALGELARSCPENFRGFWLLLSAEMEKLASRHESAARLFDEAVEFAGHEGNLQLSALAKEMNARARFDLEPAAAVNLLRGARLDYSRWGAAAKVRQMDARYGNLLTSARADTPSGVPAAAGEPESAALDLSTVLKVARAIAVEIELGDLLRTLMKLAMENAGAERGVFLQERDGALMVEAEANAGREDVRVGRSGPLDAEFAQSVVRYVTRTNQDLVVSDARADDRFGADEHVRRVDVRSILCVPVSHQGRASGILYLENNLTAGAFTPERAALTRIVAAQAAISLENARLYETMKNEVDRRTAAERALREALGELERLKNRLEAENVYLQEEIRTQHNFNEIVGNSPALLEVLRRVERVAPTESTVLILGETGSGKELFARAVHSRSRRRDRPLVKVNCGAIAPGLVESELFGHVKGAFTGAIDKRVGRFELASGGTIFLDEVGELPPDAQVKLLRVLQEQEFEPVGSSRTVRVDVRVIAATNRDLERAVKGGTFRADLLYRLNVFPVEVPPLRRRVSDIPLLVSFFVAGLGRKLGKPIQGFSTRSMERLLAYSWPGNVRELQNVVERAAILCQDTLLDLDIGFGEDAAASQERPPLGRRTGADRLDDVQREHILDVLRTTGGVVGGSRGAAAILGLHPNTLRSRMKRLGISAVSPDAS